MLPIRQTPAPHLAWAITTFGTERVTPEQGRTRHVTMALVRQWEATKARHYAFSHAHASYDFVRGGKKKKKKRPTKLSSSDCDGGVREGGGKKSLDDLNTIIYGPIHSDDVVIWAVIMIVIIIVDEKDFYLGFM